MLTLTCARAPNVGPFSSGLGAVLDENLNLDCCFVRTAVKRPEINPELIDPPHESQSISASVSTEFATPADCIKPGHPPIDVSSSGKRPNNHIASQLHGIPPFPFWAHIPHLPPLNPTSPTSPPRSLLVSAAPFLPQLDRRVLPAVNPFDVAPLGGVLPRAIADSEANEKRRSEKLGASCMSAPVAGPSKSGTSDSTGLEFSDSMVSSQSWLSDVRELVIEFNTLTFERRIGEGSFTEVYSGRWLDSQVAIKVFKCGPPLIRHADGTTAVVLRDQGSDILDNFEFDPYFRDSVDNEVRTRFLQEVALLVSHRHPNVLFYIGACVAPEYPLCIVSELIDGCSLFSLLHSRESKKLSLCQKLGLAQDIARGMHYLHGRSPPVLHRDLKSANILIQRMKDGELKATIIDFGLSKLLSTEVSHSNDDGLCDSLVTMAPEVLARECYHPGSDVYSFSIILWEIFTERVPFRNLAPSQLVNMVATEKKRPVFKQSDVVPEEIKQLIDKCWHHDFRMRPEFMFLVRELSQIRSKPFLDPEVGTRNIFIELSDCITNELGKLYLNNGPSEVEELESMLLSEYLSWLSFRSSSFLDLVMKKSSVMDRINALSGEKWIVQLPAISLSRLTVTNVETGSFLILLDDFFLAYNEKDRTLDAKVPGSPCFGMSYDDILSRDFFDDLIGDILPIQQVYFFVRRLVQLTGAKWEFDCLAQLEKNLPNANALQVISPKILSDVTVDLLPMNFNCLSGCSVGFIVTDDESLYSAGIELHGQVIGFKRSENHLATPLVLHGVQMEDSPNYTDWCKFAVGGVHIIAEMPVNLRVGQYKSKKPNVLDYPIYNLAFVPKNAEFRYLAKQTYSMESLDELQEAFIFLGYGQQLSESLVSNVADDKYWGWSERTVTTTIEEAQALLFRRWEHLSHRNMLPFTMGSRRTKYLRAKKDLLVLNGDELHVVRCKKKVSFCIGGGFKGFIHGSMIIAENELFFQYKVSNILNAVERVSGIEDHRFESFSAGEGKIPTRCGMEDLLGAITFTCLLLKGKVRPDGRFKNCVLIPGNKQNVDFNIPLPGGVVSATLARRSLQVRHWMLVDGKWDVNRDYEYPVVLGVEKNDQELRRTMSLVNWSSRGDRAQCG